MDTNMDRQTDMKIELAISVAKLFQLPKMRYKKLTYFTFEIGKLQSLQTNFTMNCEKIAILFMFIATKTTLKG